ncbi:MAG: ATP synthase F1 subunit epsilon [Alphaproteobacteria bacterium]|nr:ATP synthase F1 subunit epsilon [Alphaproteobacteria bacterium]
MAAAFHLRIISPAAVLVDAPVTSVQIPGVEGDFGVLSGHSNVFSMIRPGVIDVALTDGTRRHFFAATGYADVTPTQCTVISDHLQDLADISAVEAQEALAAARLAFSQAETPDERTQAQAVLHSAEALAAAVSNR